ncbi:MAG: polysaccharide pyruvyl transferase family protein [Terracidiphilus sp.]
MRIALFNVKYSANLGDGLLSHCLASELAASRPNVQVAIYDLAGRSSYGEGAGRRKTVLGIMNHLPASIRRVIAMSLLGPTVLWRLRPVWAEAITAADAVVIGGGNLLSDTDLNFPLKIAGLCAEIRNAGRSWELFGVGIADDWSRFGKKLFESALLTPLLLRVSVRDARSKILWDAKIACKGTPAAVVCYDPAVLVCDHFPAPARIQRSRPVLGLNITAPSEIALHADMGFIAGRAMFEWWVELVRLALQAGYEVRLFTNGQMQDQEFLLSLQPVLESSFATGGRLSFSAVPRNPASLAAIIADCDVLAGHRLHAHIPAFSYRIPSVGFVWDEKLKSFFEVVGRDDFLMDMQEASPAEAVGRITHALESGVDQNSWLTATRAARQQIGEMAALMCSVLAKKSNDKI